MMMIVLIKTLIIHTANSSRGNRADTRGVKGLSANIRTAWFRGLRVATLVSPRLRGVRGRKIHAAAAMVCRTSWRVLNSSGIVNEHKKLKLKFWVGRIITEMTPSKLPLWVKWLINRHSKNRRGVTGHFDYRALALSLF